MNNRTNYIINMVFLTVLILFIMCGCGESSSGELSDEDYQADYHVGYQATVDSFSEYLDAYFYAVTSAECVTSICDYYDEFSMDVSSGNPVTTGDWDEWNDYLRDAIYNAWDEIEAPEAPSEDTYIVPFEDGCEKADSVIASQIQGTDFISLTLSYLEDSGENRLSVYIDPEEGPLTEGDWRAWSEYVHNTLVYGAANAE